MRESVGGGSGPPAQRSRNQKSVPLPLLALVRTFLKTCATISDHCYLFHKDFCGKDIQKKGGYRWGTKNEEEQNAIRWSESDRSHFLIPIYNPPSTFRRAAHYAQVRTNIRGSVLPSVGATIVWLRLRRAMPLFQNIVNCSVD